MKDILVKLFGGGAGEVGDKLSGVIDKFVHTKDEKAAFEKEMTTIFINAEAEIEKNISERYLQSSGRSSADLGGRSYEKGKGLKK